MKIFKIFPIIILVLGLAACGGSGGDGSGDIDSGDDGEFIVSGSATVGDISISFPKAVIASTLEGNFFAVPAEDDALAALVKATGDDADLALCVAEDAVDAELVHDDNADGTTMSAGLDLRDVDPMSALILCILPDAVEFASGGRVGGRAMRIEAEEALLQFGVWKLYPAFGAKDVPPEEDVLAFFNSAAKADDVTAENFYLTKIEGGALTTPDAAVSLSESGRIATLDPKSTLDENQKYYARLRGIIRDEAGAGRIGATIIWSFTTGEKSAVAWPPCDESNCLQFMTEALGDGKCNMFEGDPGKAPGGGVGYDYPAETFLLLLKDAKEQEKLASLACMVNYATSEAHRSAIMGGCLPLDLAFELMAAGECGLGEGGSDSPEELLNGENCEHGDGKPQPGDMFNYTDLITLFQASWGLDEAAAAARIECILNTDGIQDYIEYGCLPVNEAVMAAGEACAGGGDECSSENVVVQNEPITFTCEFGSGSCSRSGNVSISNGCGEQVSWSVSCTDYGYGVDICNLVTVDPDSGTLDPQSGYGLGISAVPGALGVGEQGPLGQLTVSTPYSAIAVPVFFTITPSDYSGPVAVADFGGFNRNVGGIGSIGAYLVLDNDTYDPSEPPTLTITQQGSCGTAVVHNEIEYGRVHYTLNSFDCDGDVDQFQYQIQDSVGSSVAWVTISFGYW